VLIAERPQGEFRRQQFLVFGGQAGGHRLLVDHGRIVVTGERQSRRPRSGAHPPQ
jgi:hypothetical protein